MWKQETGMLGTLRCGVAGVTPGVVEEEENDVDTCTMSVCARHSGKQVSASRSSLAIAPILSGQHVCKFSPPKKSKSKKNILPQKMQWQVSLRPIRGHRPQELLHWRSNVNIMAMPRSLTTKQSSRICTQGSIGIWMPPMMSHQTILQRKPTILQSTPIIARVSQHSMLDCVHAGICASRQNKNFM